MRRLFPVLLLGAALLSGCASAASGAGKDAPADTTRIAMAKSYVFSPSAIRVAPGDTVTWVNEDNFTHNVRVSGPVPWQSQTIAPGDSDSHAFAEPGEYAYECTLHPNMRGTIVVAARELRAS